MRRSYTFLLIAATFALGACGGDSNKNDNASNSTSTETTTQKTDTTTTTGGTKTTEDKGKGSGKSKSDGSNSGSGGSGGSGSGSGGNGSSTTTTPTAGGKTSPYNTAKTVCGSFLPVIVERQIKHHKRTPKSFARQYSRAWPKEQRSDAYRGCLTGIRLREK